MPPTSHQIAAAVAAFAMGTVIWAASPIVTGRAEPWDAESGYYVAALFGGGIVLGLLRPRSLWVHYCGAFLGQFAYMVLFVGIGPLIAIGIIFLAAYTCLLWVGALGGSKLRTEFLDVKRRRHDGT